MQHTSLGDLFGDLGFLAVFGTLLLVLLNVMVGVSMWPSEDRKKRYAAHRLVHGAVLVFYIVFLWVNDNKTGNIYYNYFVFLYFLIIVPMVRRMNLTLHAVLASVGMVLLGWVVVTSL